MGPLEFKHKHESGQVEHTLKGPVIMRWSPMRLNDMALVFQK